VPDRSKQATQAQKRLEKLRNERDGTLSLRDMRTAEVAELSQRLDALMARADSLRREQSNLVSAATKGGAEARSLSLKQTRLQLDVRSMVLRIEDLRARREIEQVSETVSSASAFFLSG
jgi:uncharacterized coiled-coil DUF342 family protein